DERCIRHRLAPVKRHHLLLRPKRIVLISGLRSSSCSLTLLASSRLRSESDSVPSALARVSFSAWRGATSRVAVLPTTTRWPFFSSTVWSIASTRTLVKIVSLVGGGALLLLSLSLARRERITSTRSLGRMKPPAPVSGEISVETARMPDG